MSNGKNIIKGYQGIMDLDLSSIDPKFHKEMIDLHSQDIRDYKIEQQERPSKLRYENAIVRAYKTLRNDKRLNEKIAYERRQTQQEGDARREEIIQRIKDSKKTLLTNTNSAKW